MAELSEQQEAFCRNVVEGMSQAEAYLKAGYKCKPADARCHASALITKHNVAARVDALRSEATESSQVTLQWLIDEAKDVLLRAKKDGSYAASVSAIKELGVLTGERVEKRDSTNRQVSDESGLSRDELYAIARGRSAGDTPPRPGSRELN